MNAIMSDVEFRNAKEAAKPEWSGLAELDRALADNRLTEYRFKKARADPWSRKLTIAGIFTITAVFAFLIGVSVLS